MLVVRARVVSQVGQIKRLVRQLAAARAERMDSSARRISRRDANIGARLSEKAVVLRARLGEERIALALLPYANAALDEREASTSMAANRFRLVRVAGCWKKG